MIGSVPIGGASAIVAAASAAGGGGVLSNAPWVQQLAFAASVLGRPLDRYLFTDLLANNDNTAGGAPTQLTTSDGGVIQFGAINQTITFPGTVKFIANPTATNFMIAARLQLIDSPTAASTQDWLFAGDGGSNSIGVELTGSTSTTIPRAFFNKAASLTFVNMNTTIGTGITVGTFFELAIVGSVSAVTFYINRQSVLVRSDMANCPTAALFLQTQNSAGTQRWNVDWLFEGCNSPT